MPGLKQATTKQRPRCQGCAWGGQAPPRWPRCPHCQGRAKGYSDSHQCPKQTVQNSRSWGRWDVTAPLLSQLRVQFSLCPSPSKQSPCPRSALGSSQSRWETDVSLVPHTGSGGHFKSLPSLPQLEKHSLHWDISRVFHEKGVTAWGDTGRGLQCLPRGVAAGRPPSWTPNPVLPGQEGISTPSPIPTLTGNGNKRRKPISHFPAAKTAVRRKPFLAGDPPPPTLAPKYAQRGGPSFQSSGPTPRPCHPLQAPGAALFLVPTQNRGTPLLQGLQSPSGRRPRLERVSVRRGRSAPRQDSQGARTPAFGPSQR